MVKCSHPRAGIAGLCLALAGVASAAEPVLLRYKFQPEQVQAYRLRIDQRLEVVSDLNPDAAQRVKSHLEVDYSNRVVSVQGGDARLGLTFKRVRAELEVNGQRVQAPEAQQLRKVRVEMKMTARGELSDVRLLDSEPLDSEAKLLVEELRRSIAGNALTLPERPIAVGESWSADRLVSTKLPGAEDLPMKLTGRYKLAKLEQRGGKPVAKVDVSIKLSLRGETEQMGIPLVARLVGAGDGTALFGIDDGQLHSVAIDYLIKGTIQASHQGQQVATGLKLDMKTDLRSM